jgi:histidine kinase
MKLRWKLFFSYLAAVMAVVTIVALAIRSIALSATRVHMQEMGQVMGGMAGMMSDLEEAVSQGMTEALLGGGVAAVVVAVVASYLVSGWLVGVIGRVAHAAKRIAAGEYGQRVAYEADDEIGELARSFNEMAARLEETEQVRRELLGTISHELRTPLTNIQGYMEGLIDGVVPEEPATYQRVYLEASRLARLVTDIERLSRVEAGVEPVEPKPLPTSRVVLESVERLRPQFEQKPLELVTELAPGLPRVMADEDKLIQVLVNLMANSFKYTPAGGRVTVRAGAAGTQVRLEVEDTGEGIPGEDLPHIFERFYRVDKSRSAAGGGAGIGLAVTKSLVERMGGSIRAESRLGEGTTVTFLLPVAPD